MVALLNEDFLSQYKGVQPGWGPIGWFTFKRTYARRIEEENRTEEWNETVERVVKGNLSIIANDPLITSNYAQNLYHIIFNLIATPPGRGLWQSGSEFSRRTGDAMVNCWFTETRPYHYGETNKIFTRYQINPYKKYISYPFVFLFDESMKGGGVGFSVEKKFLKEIPRIKNRVQLYMKLDKNHADYAEIRQMANSLGIHLNVKTPKHIDVDLMIADSREGWAESLAVVIDRHFEGKNQTVVLDFSEIRKRGDLIVGFGGVSSGSSPLVELLHNVNELLNLRKKRYLTSIDATDIYNQIGKAVVAGGIRRTAEVALGDNQNKEFINMKNWSLYDQYKNEVITETGDKISIPKSRDEIATEFNLSQEEAQEILYEIWSQNNHRWASNNSVVIDNPRNYNFGFIAPAISENGEPGMYNRFLAQNFKRIIDGYKEMCDKATGGNPCMEISLISGEPCNLIELHLPKLLEFGMDAEEVIPMMVQYAKRITFCHYDWELSREVIQRNRRIGISLSGIQDWILLKWGRSAITGWALYKEDQWDDMVWLSKDKAPYSIVEELPVEYDGYAEPIYLQEIIDELDRMYKLVIKADEEYSALLTKVLGYTVNPSVKVTTVKPSGTISLLSGITPGMHWSYFETGIRRVTCQKDDPLIPLAKECGYRVEDSVTAPNAVVIEFPYEAVSAGIEGFKSCEKISIEEQFAMQAMLQIWWADNMVSCTISFHEHEKHKIEKLLRQYRMRIKSTSMFPYREHGYLQPPWEPTSRDIYEQRKEEITMKIEDLYKSAHENNTIKDEEMTLIDSVECTKEGCPVR